jgi:putative FmdB family regulatory protein
MPNYKYKCYSCNLIDEIFLPISTDPQKLFCCPGCPDGTMRRMTGLINPAATLGLKVFAGDWYKKTYGHELGEDGESAAEKKRDLKRALEQHKKDNS